MKIFWMNRNVIYQMEKFLSNFATFRQPYSRLMNHLTHMHRVDWALSVTNHAHPPRALFKIRDNLYSSVV